MGTVVGNIGSTTTATVTNTSSTNTGLSLNLGSGVHIVRVPGNVTLSGGNTIGKPGLTLSGTGKAIVLQEGGTITGGPGNTSNNYGGTGGQGATALVSNITTKVIKTYGNIVGGSGGGGGRGKGSIERSAINSSYWNFPALNGTYYQWVTGIFNYTEVWNTGKSLYNSYTTGVAGGSSLNWNIVNNINNISNGNIVAPIHGNDGTNGTPRSPGQTGNSGNAGNNGTPGIGNSAVLNSPFGQNFGAQSSGRRNINNYTDTTKAWGIGRANSTQLYLSYNVTVTNRNISGYNIVSQYNLYGYIINNANTPANSSYSVNGSNVIKFTANTVNYNAKVNPTSGGPGGNPGNAYNTTNVTTPFG